MFLDGGGSPEGGGPYSFFCPFVPFSSSGEGRMLPSKADLGRSRSSVDCVKMDLTSGGGLR